MEPGVYLRLSYGLYRHVRAVVVPLFEYYFSIHQGEEGMVFTQTYVFTGVMLGATLTHDNVTGFCGLSTIEFYA